MDKNLTLIEPILKQLQINYDPNNLNDLQQLKQILTKKLSYPSTELAMLHVEANRLGVLDMRNHKNDCGEVSRSSGEDGQGRASQYQIQDIVQCQCCGLAKQPKSLNFCTKVGDVRSVGIATRFVFFTYQHLILLMIVMFFVYSLYAIISNVKSCNYDANNLKDPYRTAEYQGIMSSWVFQVSLQANLSCSPDSRTYEIQCWLGVVFIILTGIILIFLKYRKFRACLILEKTTKSVHNLSIFIQNMPVCISKKQLESQLRQYRKKYQDPDMPESLVEINVVKVNRAAPFYLSSTVFKDKKIEESDKKYNQAKQKLINMVLERRKKAQFSLIKQKRVQIYHEFERVKKQRIKTYQEVVLSYVLQQKQKNPNKLIKAPTFITFESSFNRQFMLKMHSGPQTLINGQKMFKFSIPNSDKKVSADISQAPKPQQVLWTNLGQKNSSLIFKKITFTIVTLAFLAGTCAAYYYLQLFNFDFARSGKTPAQTISISYFVQFIGLVVSYIISDVILYFTRRQRNITYMHEQKSLNNKATIASLSNWMLVPFIFNLFFLSQFVSITSLSQTVYTMSLFTAYYFVVLKAVDPLYFWFLYKKRRAKRPENKLAMSQRKLNRKLQRLQFMPGFECSYAIRATLFACFFSPLQPIVIVFLLSGLIFMDLQNKYYLYYRSTRPVPGNRMVNISINKYLVFGPILFGVGCLIWPYYINQKVIAIAPSVISISLGVLFSFVPWEKIIDRYLQKALLQKVIQKVERYPQDNKDKKDQKPMITTQIAKKQKFYSRNKHKFEYEYDRLNYLTAKQAIQKYMKEQGLMSNEKSMKRVKFRNNLNIINNLGTIVKSANSKKNILSFINNTIEMNKYKDSHLQPIQTQSSTMQSANPHNPMATNLQSSLSLKQMNDNKDSQSPVQDYSPEFYELTRQIYSHAYEADDHEQLMQAILEHIKNNIFIISESKNMVFWKNNNKNELANQIQNRTANKFELKQAKTDMVANELMMGSNNVNGAQSEKLIVSSEMVGQLSQVPNQGCECQMTRGGCQLI